MFRTSLRVLVKRLCCFVFKLKTVVSTYLCFSEFYSSGLLERDICKDIVHSVSVIIISVV